MESLSLTTLAAIAVGIVLYGWHQQKQRTMGMRSLARRLGMTFVEKPPVSITLNASRFGLFDEGTDGKVRNHMTVRRNGRTVSVFDFAYTVWTGKQKITYRQTVTHIHAPDANLPAFTLRPEHMLHRIGGIVGYQDIDVHDDPAFSEAYLLRGDNEERIRARFTAPVRDFYTSNRGFCTQASGSDLILWRDRHTVPTGQIVDFIQSANLVVGRLAGASRPRGAGA